MIARRGFLAGCLAVVAAPVLRFIPREKPITWLLYVQKDAPDIEIRQFSQRVEVWCDGVKWKPQPSKRQSWMVFGGNSERWYGSICFRQLTDGFDVDWYALSDHPLPQYQPFRTTKGPEKYHGFEIDRAWLGSQAIFSFLII